MKVIKSPMYNGTTRVSLKKDNKILSFELQLLNNVYNLVCTMDSPSNVNDIKYDELFDISMIITEENEAVYRLFEKLFIDIDNLRENLKATKVSALSYGHTSEILSEDKKKITWFSDLYSRTVSNYMTIDDLMGSYKVTLHTQLPKKEFEQQQGSSVHIPVIINNNDTCKMHSANYPYNICFMTLYDGLKELPEIEDELPKTGEKCPVEEKTKGTSNKRLAFVPKKLNMVPSQK